MEQNTNNSGSTQKSFVERLAENLGSAANATRIYGSPVERDGVTVIPVAKAAYGFGGGAGKKAAEEGSGGGGGLMLTPIGYIELKEGSTRFRSIQDSQTWIKLLAVGGLFTLLTMRTIAKLYKKKENKH
jgi:uncharacterized spore protein YtfJ